MVSYEGAIIDRPETVGVGVVKQTVSLRYSIQPLKLR